MVYTCKVCKFTHSCRCGGKKCKCWMNLWQAKIAEKLINVYKIEDTKQMVDLILQKKNEESILNTLWVENIQNAIETYEEKKINTKTTILDDRFARTIWMKSVYCEYPSFNDNAICKFCWRNRKEWYMKPCLYYLTKLEEQKTLNNK